MEAIMDTVVLEWAATAAPVKRRLRFGRKQLALAGLALAIALGGIGYGRYWWTTGRFIETTDDAYVGGNVTTLSPHVAGFVSQILVADNQFVRTGELVITLDDRDYKAGLAHAEAAVQNQTAALANLHAKSTLLQSMIEQAQAQLASDQAEAGWARADATHYHALALTTYGTVQNDQKAFAADRKAAAAVRAGRRPSVSQSNSWPSSTPRSAKPRRASPWHRPTCAPPSST
jgi:membrane fusion protein (multidrug efflux system)